MNAYTTRTPTPASPDLLQSLTPRRSRRRGHKHLRRRLSSPVTAFIVVIMLAAAGAGIASRIEDQHQIRAFLMPRAWPARTVGLPIPVTAALTTDLGGSFLHYTFTIRPGSGTPADVSRQLEGVNFTIRLLDQDGFTILVTRPTTELLRDLQADGSISYHLEDAVGCSRRMYANATSWTVEWEGI